MKCITMLDNILVGTKQKWLFQYCDQRNFHLTVYGELNSKRSNKLDSTTLNDGTSNSTGNNWQTQILNKHNSTSITMMTAILTN